MPQRTHHYTAFMPMGRDRKIVHLRCNDEKCTYRYISFEQSLHGLGVLGVRCAPDDALHLEARYLDEETIKGLIVDFNHREGDQVEIELHPSLCISVTGSGEPQKPLTTKLGDRKDWVPPTLRHRQVSPPFEDHDHASEE